MSSYRAPPWLPGGHAQTIYPLLLRTAPPAYRRSRWETPDGDFVDVDWMDAPGCASLVVLFHGLEGSSRSHYAVALAHALAARGRRGAIPHFRGCSGEPNRLPRAYHSGDHAEIDWMLRRLRAAFPSAAICAVGVSLGASALLNWLGRHGEEALHVVDAAVAVSAPVDLAAAGHALGRGFNRVYSRHFLASMKRGARAKLARFPGLFDGAALAACRSLYAFDDLVTAPLHGFRGVDDYWTRASSKPWLAGIAVPTLLLNALNDPFLPAAALPAPAQVSAAVALEYPPEGGHAGFVSGAFPGRLAWLPARVLAFCDEHARPGARVAMG